MNRLLPAVLVGAAVLAGVPAHAATPGEGDFSGTTTTRTKVSFALRPAKAKGVRQFAIGYRATCTDGERLNSTFRFFPIALGKAGSLAVTGSTAGTLADGRAFTSRVSLTGSFTGTDSAHGRFRLITRIPDPSGGVAVCTTGAVRWTVARR